MAFDILKTTFISVPILACFNPDWDIIVKIVISDYISAGVLSQYDDDNILHPITYFSKNHFLVECSYEIHNKELMAII
jgi:hypothetical protein